jgi:DNA modification methylase
VRDPPMGSGLTLVAARALNHQVIGVELSLVFHETAVKLPRGREFISVAA